MEPILKAHFNRFKSSFELTQNDGNENAKRDAEAFEWFVNYIIFSTDYPDIFIGNIDLLDFISVGGANDTGIDGIGIKVNDRLVGSIEDIDLIVGANKKVSIEFVFIQSKMQESFEASELNNFGLGVKHFFSDPVLPENDKVKKLRELKDYLYENEGIVSKWEDNPILTLYYVGTGNGPISEHFNGTIDILESELSKKYFKEVKINAITGKILTKFCKEIENSFSVQISINDILPLSVNAHKDVKKAYAFTCSATEFLKILTKDDNTLRRSLFNDNVRDYLGSSGVNVEIENTIQQEPEMFLLCNNGVTIVCSDFDQIRDKLVKIENPQIVNGCQTSNSIFKYRNNQGIEQVQIIVRLICTEDINISNKIVRGTNKQNQVLDEAFEATKPFHQNLEEYFASKPNDNPKLYYERRAKQYSNDPLINKTQIVNLRIITQSFIGMFLGSPHECHRHEAKLLEDFLEKRSEIYDINHDPELYYLTALTWYRFETAFRQGKSPSKYKAYKAHLYMVFKDSVGIYPPSSYKKSRSLNNYTDKLSKILVEPNFDAHLTRVIQVFESAINKWQKEGNSYHAMKDRNDFTKLLMKESRNTFLSKETKPAAVTSDGKREGEIFTVGISKKTNRCFGFIKQYNGGDNLYFDERYFMAEARYIVPKKKITYKVKYKEDKEIAYDVELLS